MQTQLPNCKNMCFRGNQNCMRELEICESSTTSNTKNGQIEGLDVKGMVL